MNFILLENGVCMYVCMYDGCVNLDFGFLYLFYLCVYLQMSLDR